MAEERNPEPQRERREFTRYCVNLTATAFRPPKRLPPGVPAQVTVRLQDISQVACRWHSRELFYKEELVGLNLATDQDGLALQCAVRVYRVRRISGMYEVVGHFLRVNRKETAAARAPAAATPAGAQA